MNLARPQRQHCPHWSATSSNGGSSWSFDANNGELVINFSASFPTTPGTHTDFTIEVQARDSQGLTSGYHDYVFQAYNATVTDLTTNYTGTSTVVSEPGSIGASQITGSNNNIFLGVDPRPDHDQLRVW
jgi:hypothetical protein